MVAQGGSRGFYLRALMAIIYELLMNHKDNGERSTEIDTSALTEDYFDIVEPSKLDDDKAYAFIHNYTKYLHDVDHGVIENFADAIHAFGKLGVVKWLYETYGAQLATYIKTTQIKNTEEICRYYRSSLGLQES